MRRVELLAPAGNMEKLKTAIYFGADAVYFGGKAFGLRAYAGNFDAKETADAVNYCHKLGKKAYVTVNVFGRNTDFLQLGDYFALLESAGADAVIVSDPGIAAFLKKGGYKLKLHVSTQANVTNKYAASVWADMGAERIILARELSLEEISEISASVAGRAETEVFVHGAMCISYSGRCLLSNYLADRDSNRGECVQACRWEYSIREKNRQGGYLDIEEDDRGTYILNSKDLCLIDRLKELADAGVSSFKIEGRMKTAYYTACVVNSYRRALDCLYAGEDVPAYLTEELYKTGHRSFTEGFLRQDKSAEVNLDTSKTEMTYDFVAVVKEYDKKTGRATVEHRNRFFEGETLEILSPDTSFNCTFVANNIRNKAGENVSSANLVQEILTMDCPYPLKKGDILRRKSGVK